MGSSRLFGESRRYPQSSYWYLNFFPIYLSIYLYIYEYLSFFLKTWKQPLNLVWDLKSSRSSQHLQSQYMHSFPKSFGSTRQGPRSRPCCCSSFTALRRIQVSGLQVSSSGLETWHLEKLWTPGVLSVFCLKNLVFLHETMMISSQKKTRRLMPFMGSGGNWAQCEAKGKQQWCALSQQSKVWTSFRGQNLSLNCKAFGICETKSLVHLGTACFDHPNSLGLPFFFWPGVSWDFRVAGWIPVSADLPACAHVKS